MKPGKLYFDAEELREVVGLGRSTIWRLEKRGEFPKRRQLTGKRVGWLREDVERWARERPEAE